jgi:DNA-directed RNA polymerase sigma subunit (sigma70/sigma32)
MGCLALSSGPSIRPVPARSWHIRQAIQRWRANDVLLIRLPVHVWEGLSSPEESLITEVRLASARAQNMVSIDDMDPDDPDWNWNGGQIEAEETLDQKRLVARPRRVLTDREDNVMTLRYGVLGQQVGDSFRVVK